MSSVSCVDGAAHMNFSDAALILESRMECSWGSINPERMTLIDRDVVRAFLDVHTLGSTAAGFAATTARHDGPPRRPATTS